MTRTEEVVVSLLGRLAFPEEKLRVVVTKNKKKPLSYLRGYNACNGANGVSDVAKIIGVTAGTLVPILQQWERAGIIYEVENDRKGKFFKNLYPLEELK